MVEKKLNSNVDGRGHGQRCKALALAWLPLSASRSALFSIVAVYYSGYGPDAVGRYVLL